MSAVAWWCPPCGYSVPTRNGNFDHDGRKVRAGTCPKCAGELQIHGVYCEPKSGGCGCYLKGPQLVGSPCPWCGATLGAPIVSEATP